MHEPTPGTPSELISTPQASAPATPQTIPAPENATASFRLETGELLHQNQKIFYRLWQPESQAVAVKTLIHINHGMAEHSERYQEFATRCVDLGIAVIAHDHPGHGHSVSDTNELGHFGNSTRTSKNGDSTNGWHGLLDSMQAVQDFAYQLFGAIPTVIFGHSMGSFATLSFLEQKKTQLAISGVILSGSTQNPWYLDQSLNKLARLESWRQGKRGHSALINTLTFKAFNNKFKPNRTRVDWLSSDPQAVDAYVNDPLCGQQSTNQSWCDFSAGLLELFKPNNLEKLPRNIPYLLIAGDQDPLSNNGGLQRLETSLSHAGIKNLTSRTFPHGRHELLNEINHLEVEHVIFSWLENVST